MSNPDAFTGFLNCFTRTLKDEGPKAFYKGFVPNFTRIGVWSIACFLSMEQFKILLLGP
jgi:solute carrier family 25 uncoupling protein 8/9